MSVRSSPCVIFANSSLAQNKRDCSRYILGVEFFQFQKAAEEIFSAAVSMPEGRNLSRMSWRPPAGLWWEVCALPWMPGRLEEYWPARSPARGSRQELAEAVKAVSREDVVQVAQRVQLDSVYTLRGKEG